MGGLDHQCNSRDHRGENGDGRDRAGPAPRESGAEREDGGVHDSESAGFLWAPKRTRFAAVNTPATQIANKNCPFSVMQQPIYKFRLGIRKSELP
jgi:hypothetical protein